MNKNLCNNPKCKNYKKYARNCGHFGYEQPKETKINKVSETRKEWDKEYNKNRKKFLSEHPACQAMIEGCTKKATDIHHKRGKNSKEDYVSPSNFLAVCRHCHQVIEKNPAFAKAFGFSQSRLNKRA